MFSYLSFLRIPYKYSLINSQNQLEMEQFLATGFEIVKICSAGDFTPKQ